MTASASSRLRSISSGVRASRLRRSSGSVLDGRTFMCQSSASTVEVRDRSLAGEPLFQLLQLHSHVGNRRVQLAGDEVALAVRRKELRELPAALRDQLQHQEERDDPGVGLGEVAEVVVAGHFAPKRRVLLAHAVLDERVSDPVHERNAAGALDRLRNGPARTHVVDDLRVRVLLQH